MWGLAGLSGFRRCVAQAAVASSVRARPTLPHVVIAPPSDAQLQAMLSQPSEWAQIRPLISAILHADHNLKAVSDDVLERWFACLRRESLCLELEVGAVKPWSTVGKRTFERETPTWRRALRLGAPLISVAMDEPRSAGRGLGMTDPEIIAQVVEFVALVRERFPDLLVGDIETYPEFSVSEHSRWRRNLNAAVTRRTGRPIDFYRIDPNWSAFNSHGVSWEQVAQIQRDCHAEGIPFSLIYWASPAASEMQHGTATGDSWSREVKREAARFRAAGGYPQQVVVESWIGLPTTALPEGDAESFAGSVRGVLQELGMTF